MTSSISEHMKNIRAMGKLASMVHALTDSVMGNNPVGIIRKILANNNGTIGIAALAGELNRQLNIPEGLDTQAACIRTIMIMANDQSSFFKVDGDKVSYTITSSREELWRTAASFEEFAKYADKNNGYPHPAVDSAMNDLKVFMRSNTHAIQFVDAMTGDIPKQVATVAFSIVVAALIPTPNDGRLPKWLANRVKQMIVVDDMEVLERITCTLINMNAVFIDSLAAKQPSIAEGLDHTQINLTSFYERIPVLVEQIRELLTDPKKVKPVEVQAPVNTTHVGAGIPQEDKQEQAQQPIGLVELPITIAESEEGLSNEQAYHVRSELMSAYREIVADMSSYISGYCNQGGPSAIEHIRKVARLGLKLDLSEYSDDALESFMLFGNPGCINLDLKGAMVLAHHLRLAVRMAYIFN